MPVKILIIIGIIGMLLLAISIIFFVLFHQRRVFQYQLEMVQSQKEHEQELGRSTQDAQEQTLSHIASELHDDIGVLLSSVKLFLSKAANGGEDASFLNQSKELLDESITKIRDLSHQLHPSTLQRLGLSTAIESLLDMFQRSGLISCSFKVATPIPRLPENIELSMYRIVQELMNNLAKHGKPKHINVTLGATVSDLLIGIQHDGIGLDQEQYLKLLEKKGTIGLKNIYTRLQTTQSTIYFETADNEFSRITIRRALIN